jgi:hypothetical protein
MKWCIVTFLGREFLPRFRDPEAHTRFTRTCVYTPTPTLTLTDDDTRTCTRTRLHTLHGGPWGEDVPCNMYGMCLGVAICAGCRTHAHLL